MFRRIALMAMSTALAVALMAPGGAAQAHVAATTLSVGFLDIYYGSPGVRTQTIHIEGDIGQPISVTFIGLPAAGAPPNLQGGTRSGGSCSWDGADGVCVGQGDVTLSYGPNTYDDMGYIVQASTPDGAFEEGGVANRSRTDVEVYQWWTKYIGQELGTTANLSIGIRKVGGDRALGAEVYLRGLDTSLGLPANCSAGHDEAVCYFSDHVTSIEVITLQVPACSARRSVEVTVFVRNYIDTNDSNDYYVVPGIESWNCTHGGGSGAGSGGGGGGTGGGGGPAASASATATTSAAAVASSPASTSSSGSAPAETAAGANASADTYGGLGWVAVVSGVGLAVLLGLGGAWWWRRSKSGTPAE
jgi:hypothetical protein